MNDVRTTESGVSIGIDLGSGSMAIFARRDAEVLWHRSILVNSDHASLAARRQKRRAVLTRLAHRAREFWWNQCAQEVGIPVLKEVVKVNDLHFKIKNVDDRLKREHPSKDDASETVYNGALLRIMILEGRINELAPWQIYKAVHSAMQKRGYDPDVPWAASERDGNEITGACGEFEKFLRDNFSNPNHHFSCYFDAFKSGLWRPDSGIITQRQSYQAMQRAMDDFGGYVAPRKLKEEELKRILTAVASIYPKINIPYVLYGPALVQYGSHPKVKLANNIDPSDRRIRQGHASDWQGLLGQKVPRFDNRAVGMCCLFPRFKVCKGPTKRQLEQMPDNDVRDSKRVRLYPKFIVLTKLRNLRIMRTQDGELDPLSPEELREIFSSVSAHLKPAAVKSKVTEWCNERGFKVSSEYLDFKGTGSGRTCLAPLFKRKL